MNETMISKHDLIDVDGNWLPKTGRTYETTDCPDLEIGPQLVVVTCEDGKDRIRQKSDFKYMYEHRDERMKELGI